MNYIFKQITMSLGVLVMLSITACSNDHVQKKTLSMSNDFDYKPVKMGFGKEGYEQKKISDGSWEVKIIAMNHYSKDVLEHYFHKRASEICDGRKFLVIDFREMIDICSGGGCFKSAVQGNFKCH